MWSSKAENEIEKESCVVSREKWVPKVNPVDHNGPVEDIHLVGSMARPTFEVGEPSGFMEIGPEAGPDLVGLVLVTHQAKTHVPSRVETLFN